MAEAWAMVAGSKSLDYYQRLGLDQTASDSDIRSAYRRLLLTSHPDKLGNRALPQHVADFQAIKEAYETLSCPEKRMLYDFMGAFATLAEQSTPAFASPPAFPTRHPGATHARSEPAVGPTLPAFASSSVNHTSISMTAGLATGAGSASYSLFSWSSSTGCTGGAAYTASQGFTAYVAGGCSTGNAHAIAGGPGAAAVVPASCFAAPTARQRSGSPDFPTGFPTDCQDASSPFAASPVAPQQPTAQHHPPRHPSQLTSSHPQPHSAQPRSSRQPHAAASPALPLRAPAAHAAPSAQPHSTAAPSPTGSGRTAPASGHGLAPTPTPASSSPLLGKRRHCTLLGSGCGSDGSGSDGDSSSGGGSSAGAMPPALRLPPAVRPAAIPAAPASPGALQPAGMGASTAAAGATAAVAPSACGRSHGNVTHQLLLTLEEMYSGCLKQLKLARRVYRPSGGCAPGADSDPAAARPFPGSGSYPPGSRCGEWMQQHRHPHSHPQHEGLCEVEVEEVFRVVVEPGWREGMRLTFPGKGDELPPASPGGSSTCLSSPSSSFSPSSSSGASSSSCPSAPAHRSDPCTTASSNRSASASSISSASAQPTALAAGDMVLVVTQAAHGCYTRRGHDLHAVVAVPLADVLRGAEARLTTLDGRTVALRLGPHVLRPHSSSTVVVGEGMPIPPGSAAAARRAACAAQLAEALVRQQGQGATPGLSLQQVLVHGDLHVRFEVVFPPELSEQQREQLRGMAGGPGSGAVAGGVQG